MTPPCCQRHSRTRNLTASLKMSRRGKIRRPQRTENKSNDQSNTACVWIVDRLVVPGRCVAGGGTWLDQRSRPNRADQSFARHHPDAGGGHSVAAAFRRTPVSGPPRVRAERTGQVG